LSVIRLWDWVPGSIQSSGREALDSSIIAGKRMAAIPTNESVGVPSVNAVNERGSSLRWVERSIWGGQSRTTI